MLPREQSGAVNYDSEAELRLRESTQSRSRSLPHPVSAGVRTYLGYEGGRLRRLLQQRDSIAKAELHIVSRRVRAQRCYEPRR